MPGLSFPTGFNPLPVMENHAMPGLSFCPRGSREVMPVSRKGNEGILLANSRGRSAVRNLGRIGCPAKGLPLLSDDPDEIANSIRGMSLHPGEGEETRQEWDSGQWSSGQFCPHSRASLGSEDAESA